MQILGGLLLAFCVASPALAEIGCTTDASVHAASAQDDHAACGEDEGDRGDQPRDAHCAFGHGHCAGTASSPADAPTYLSGATALVRRDAIRLTSALTFDLDRPPRS